MLFEVVEARPELGSFGATGGKALVHPRLANVLTMDRFFVTVQVINSCKADGAARTVFFDAAILAGVAGVVFSGG